jgi:hypothetical protein
LNEKVKLKYCDSKKILFDQTLSLVCLYVSFFACATCSSFLLFAQKKGAKKRAADFDAAAVLG